MNEQTEVKSAEKILRENLGEDLFNSLSKEMIFPHPSGSFPMMDLIYQAMESYASQFKEVEPVEGKEDVRIIYKNNKPYGIRDAGGYLFFFTSITKFPNQEERYRQEVQEQYALADKLLKCLATKEETKQ